MSTKPPPVPPQNQSPKGVKTGDVKTGDTRAKTDEPAKGVKPAEKDFDQQGQTANTKQNTRHQGSHGSHDRGGD